jgi:hypothetical protein
MLLKKHILNIEEVPPVTVYKNYAYPLCIISANKINLSWIQNHFGNVYLMRNDNGYIWYDFLEPNNFAGDVLCTKYINMTDISKFDIIDLIKEKISSGRYITVFFGSVSH